MSPALAVGCRLSAVRLFRMDRRLCDVLAKKGTGLGICNRPLDEHGNCDRAADHVEEYEYPATKGADE